MDVRVLGDKKSQDAISRLLMEAQSYLTSILEGLRGFAIHNDRERIRSLLSKYRMKQIVLIRPKVKLRVAGVSMDLDSGKRLRDVYALLCVTHRHPNICQYRKNFADSLNDVCCGDDFDVELHRNVSKIISGHRNALRRSGLMHNNDFAYFVRTKNRERLRSQHTIQVLCFGDMGGGDCTWKGIRSHGRHLSFKRLIRECACRCPVFMMDEYGTSLTCPVMWLRNGNNRQDKLTSLMLAQSFYAKVNLVLQAFRAIVMNVQQLKWSWVRCAT